MMTGHEEKGGLGDVCMLVICFRRVLSLFFLDVLLFVFDHEELQHLFI